MFPLPLSCIEEYMLCDNRPAYPMTIIFRMRFSGRLDRSAFEAALADAVRRHPLLRATVERRFGRTPRWIDHPDWQPVIEWDAVANRFGFPPAGHMDLTQAPGIRVWGLAGDDGDSVILQVHHSCTDGLGMNIVMEDLLLGYASRVGDAADGLALPEVDMQRFLRRGSPGLTVWKLLGMPRYLTSILRGVWRFLMRSPAPLADSVGEIDQMAPPPVFPCPFIHELDATETKGVLTAAKSLDVTVNDLLLRDLFLATGAWRKKRRIGSDRDWLRFSVPMNLRTVADERMSMANSISSVFVDRKANEFADAGKLLEGIHALMSLIKRRQLQYIFVLSLGAARWMPGGIGRKTRVDRCRLTCWMSNLGPVLTRTPLPRVDGRIASGNVVLESVDYVIPLRPLVHAGIIVHTYSGRLQILLSIDPRTITDEDGQELLDMYIQQIQRTIAGERPVETDSCNT